MATVSYVIDLTGACTDPCCNGDPVDCPSCSIPANFTATLTGTGDLAFLDGQTVSVAYVGESGGSPSYFTWSGTATIAGWTVTVGWSIENNTLCNFVAGNIQLFKSGECDSIIQEFPDPASTTAFDCSYTGTSPETVAFIMLPQELYYSGESPPFGTQCFTGTVGMIALPTP